VSEPRLHHEFRSYLDRIKTQSGNQFDLSQVPKWMERNTSSPTDPDRRWSFKDHEYQIEILSDTSDEIVNQKCSQVGASEMWARLVLGVMSLSKAITIIYAMPTSKFAQKFSKQRLDPIIDTSKELSSQVDRSVDSSELKRIGNSFLYVTGSYGQSAAISVPAQGLFQDEVDFCNQTTLTTFNSRLGHSKPGEYYKRSFSTPTVEKYGINAMFETSSKAHYTVKCDTCHDWVAPNLLTDVEIPGFDGNLATIEKEDLSSTGVDILAAFVRCPCCKSPIKYKTLCNPSKRKWVHEHPDASVRGYQILPIDVPIINPVHRTVMQLKDYERKKDWVNFKLGYPFSDAETSFMEDVIDQGVIRDQSIARPDDPEAWAEYYPGLRQLANNTAFGLDVGKTSWFSVLARHGREIRCIYLERIRQDGNNYLGLRVRYLMQLFGCVKGVVDAGPDISVSKYLVENSYAGRVWACYYMRQQRGALEGFKVNEAEGFITTSRTESFNALARQVNSGTLRFCSHQDLPILKRHLTSMKRVDTFNDLGEMVSSWTSSEDDHYAHSLNYANLALGMLVSGAGDAQVAPSIPTMKKLRLNTGLQDAIDEALDPLGLRLGRK
jgi:hypothetical protein